MTGRGGWTRTGFPSNATDPYYELITPEYVGAAGAIPGADLSHRAVNYGVKAIQTAINERGYVPKVPVDGILGPTTATGIVWIQKSLGIAADGQFGPHSAKHTFWWYAAHLSYSPIVRHIIGGIAAHESSYDPGAVGFQDEEDLGLVQINGPANPTLTEAARFDYHVAFKYAGERITAALGTPGYTVDSAIASYGYPAVAAAWVKTGVQLFPQNPPLNQLALDYVAFVKNWDQTS